MSSIVERIPGHSNEMMRRYCEILKAVVTQSIIVKTGTGKKSYERRVYKHKTDKSIIDKILRSCDHYKELNQMDMEKNKVGSFEVVKYRLDYIDGQPKIIIEMIKVLDTNGDYIKFARLKDVIGYLSKYPIVFKQT